MRLSIRQAGRGPTPEWMSALRRAPVYKLLPPQARPSRLKQAADVWLGPRNWESAGAELSKGWIRRQSGTRIVDTVEASGAIFAVDQSQIESAEIRNRRPGIVEARRLAEEFLTWGCLWPDPEEPVQLRYTGSRRVSLGWLADGVHQDQDLDGIQIDFRGVVALTSSAGEIIDVPTVGGGYGFEVVVGGNGRIVSFAGAWRELEGYSFESELIPRAEVDYIYYELAKCIDLDSHDVRFGYYAAPITEVQTFLYPVHFYRGWSLFNEGRLPLLEIPLPATRFGPPLSREGIASPTPR